MLIRVNDEAAKELKQGQKVWLTTDDEVYEGTFVGIVNDTDRQGQKSDFLTFKISTYNGPEQVDDYSTWVYTTKEEADGAVNEEWRGRIAIQRAFIRDKKAIIHSLQSDILARKREIRRLQRLWKKTRQA